MLSLNHFSAPVATSLRLPRSIALPQGYRMLSGQSREPMMGLIVKMTRSAVIVAAATTMAVGSVDLQQFFTHDLARGINHLVTGKDESPVKAIDENLAWTQVAMGANPSTNPAANPAVNLPADAAAALYVTAAAALLADDQTDALLFLHAPTAMVASDAIALAVAPLLQAAGRNVLSCWLGGASAARARQHFADAGLPTFDTPETAVHGFLQMAQYRRNQALLMEVPAAPVNPLSMF